MANSVRGFTLFEVLLVIGMFTILGGVVSFVDINHYRADAFRAERRTLLVSLQTARADAQNNINQQPHGVAIHPEDFDGYVIFEGVTYESSTVREIVPSHYTVAVGSTTPPEIIFHPLSGNTNYSDIEITLIDPVRDFTETIFINHEGAII